jgi:ankyrin repeat protein
MAIEERQMIDNSKQRVSNAIIAWISGDLMLSDEELTRVDIKNWKDDFNNYTALHYAVSECNINAIRKLLFLGVPVCGTDERGMTPLHLAVRKCMHEIAEVVCAAGGNYCPPNHAGQHPIHIATRCDTGECVRLVASPSTVNHVDNSDDTPLMYCARFGTVASARALLELGADQAIPSGDASYSCCLPFWACRYG